MAQPDAPDGMAGSLRQSTTGIRRFGDIWSASGSTCTMPVPDHRRLRCCLTVPLREQAPFQFPMAASSTQGWLAESAGLIGPRCRPASYCFAFPPPPLELIWRIAPSASPLTPRCVGGIRWPSVFPPSGWAACRPPPSTVLVAQILGCRGYKGSTKAKPGPAEHTMTADSRYLPAAAPLGRYQRSRTSCTAPEQGGLRITQLTPFVAGTQASYTHKWHTVLR